MLWHFYLMTEESRTICATVGCSRPLLSPPLFDDDDPDASLEQL